jgi:hypothetical protein
MLAHHSLFETCRSYRTSCFTRKVLYTTAAMMLLLRIDTALGQEIRESICLPLEAAATRERVQLRCANEVKDGWEVVHLIVVPTTDTEFANRFLNTANATVTAGRAVFVQYQSRPWSFQGPLQPGCDIKECRSATAIGIR